MYFLCKPLPLFKITNAATAVFGSLPKRGGVCIFSCAGSDYHNLSSCCAATFDVMST